MTNPESRPKQHLISLPKRGLRVIAPEYTQQVMALARRHMEEGTRYTEEEKQDLWPDTEKTRIQVIKQCGTLAKRYPNPQAGKSFMNTIDYERREELLDKAHNLSEDIVSSWQAINPDAPIAIILFGSVAKGLVKRTEHPNPSNIDIAVIGDISSSDREKLMDEIRPQRKSVQEWILERVPFISTQEANPGNAGVCVQNIAKLRSDNYEPVVNYIASGAIALHDPSGLWKDLETEALIRAKERMERKKLKKLPKKDILFSNR